MGANGIGHWWRPPRKEAEGMTQGYEKDSTSPALPRVLCPAGQDPSEV